jgi:hypothetical protein
VHQLGPVQADHEPGQQPGAVLQVGMLTLQLSKVACFFYYQCYTGRLR